MKLEAKGKFISSMSSDQKKNMDVIIQVFKDGGITNPMTIAGVLGIVSKESAFLLVRENMSYGSVSRLKEIFGISSSKAEEIVGDPKKIANWVYGASPYGKRSKSDAYGNVNANDGYDFRGGGFNQLTFKGIYADYSKAAGVDLSKSPGDIVTSRTTAAKVLLEYFKKGMKMIPLKEYGAPGGINDFKDLQNAVLACYHTTAGIGHKVSKIKALLVSDSLGGMTKAQHRKEEFYEYVKKFSGLKEPLGAILGTSTTNSESTGQEKSEEAVKEPPAPPLPPDPRLDGFIRLEKVSGPGEIMGKLEGEIIFGQSIFTGVQFDKEGDYVIRAVPSSDLVEPTEFLIKVQLNENPPSSEKPVENEPDGQRVIITQIDEPTYKLPPIQMPIQDGDKKENLETVKQVGLTPFFWFNGYQIKELDIKYLILYYDGMVPACEISFQDSAAILKKSGFPLDDSTFDIFINSASKVLKSIHLRFKLSNFQENTDKSYTITGTIDLRDFYKVNYKSWTGTSFEALRKMANELELGFNSNINNTTDTMKWTNTGMKYRDFISDVVKHSYISDESFTLAYIDFYYCLNYVDVEKEWLRDIKKDLGISSGGVPLLAKKAEEDNLIPLVLTNEKSEHSANTYFQNYTVQNNSTNKSITNGQFTISKYYDTASKSFLIFNVDSLTTPDDTKLVLKGKPTDSTEIQTNYTTIFGGRVDLSNVHKNYLYAEVLNKRNLSDLSKISVTLELPQCNYNLYKFQKIRILFVNEAPTIVEEDLTQKRISGEWMIVDIKFSWSKGQLTQTVQAVRKELEKLPEEIQNEKLKEGTEPSKEGNTNELVEETPPNSIYKVDEIYTIQDKDGKTYELSVKVILENGNEISAWIYED